MQLVDQAARALQSGNLSLAKALCGQALHSNPKNVDAIHLIGVVAGREGEHQRAADLMGSAIALAPDRLNFRRNLITALLRLAAFERAEQVIREGLQRRANEPSLLAPLGAALAGQGRTNEGIAALGRSLELAPRNPRGWFNLGELYRQQRQQDEAIECFRRSIALAPNYEEAFNNLAGIHLDRGEFLEALKCMQQLLKIQPRSAQAYCNLATIMRAAGELDQSVIAVRNAIQLDPSVDRAHYQLANLLINVGQLDEAEQIIRLLSETNAESTAVKVTHARILERQGRVDQAAEVLETISEENLTHPDAAVVRAIVYEEQGQVDRAIEVLEGQLQSDERLALEGIGIQFLLGSLYDRVGRFDEAFEKVAAGNWNRKQAFFHLDELKQNGAVTDRLIKVYSKRWFETAPASAELTTAPIFIVGMPRSGTSLTEQILANHPRVYAAGELAILHDELRKTYARSEGNKSSFEVVEADPSTGLQCLAPKDWDNLTAEVLTQIGRGYMQAVQQLGGEEADHFTDKMPYNFLLTPLIAKVFPQARIIHTRRHPLDTCISCFFQNFTGGNQYTFDLQELGEFYRSYMQLMSHYRDVVQVPMIEIDYETLVSEPEPAVRELLDYCGLEWDPNCLRTHKSTRVIHTASYQQVRRPIYTKSVGRWRHYERHLAPLIEAMGFGRELFDEVSPRL